MPYVTAGKATQILGVCFNTLQNWQRAGRIDGYKEEGRRWCYDVESYLKKEQEEHSPTPRTNVIYARVSSASQKSDLQRQSQLLRKKYPHYRLIQDVGSGLNFHRRGLLSLLELANQKKIGEVVVAYRDRLSRFGFELVEQVIRWGGGKVTVLYQKDQSPQEELVEDLLSIVTVFSARVNGLRKYRKKLQEEFGEEAENSEDEN